MSDCPYSKSCTFIITEKKPGEEDKWEAYSKILEKRAIKRFNKE